MAPDRSKRQLAFRWCKRALRWCLFACVAYLAVLLIGLIPVNNDYVPPEQGITVYVVSNAVHADIIVPRRTQVVNWDEPLGHVNFVGDIANQTHVAFGWGDRGFFLKTKTWDDLKLSVAANALLLPSRRCMHVTVTSPAYYPHAVAVTISRERYRDLVRFIESSFLTDSTGHWMQIEGEAYSLRDAFFDAQGSYHFLNTCNSWVGRGLKTAGVRVPWLSPMPQSPTMYVPVNDLNAPLGNQ